MSGLVNNAMMLAMIAHKGQEYNGGSYFKNHVCKVVNCVKNYTKKWERVKLYSLSLDQFLCVAYLHDTIEDTDVDYSVLEDMFGEGIADAVDGLTKDGSLTYKGYISYICGSLDLSIIKYADLLVNLGACENYKHSLKERYLDAMGVLEAKWGFKKEDFE